jgi:hypothetical protein
MTRRKSPVRTVALALADAMLAGIAESRAVKDRCAQALGERPFWLPRLVQHALRRFAGRWHPSLRHELAETLAAHWLLAGQWPEHLPRVRRWFINAPTMQRALLGTQAVTVPDLPTTGDLAAWLRMPVSRLLWFADPQLRNERAPRFGLRHYVVRAVPKRHGGWRIIEAPKQELRAIQRALLEQLVSYVPPHEAAHGFRAGHSPLTHAQLHAGNAVVLRLDLEDFFLGIERARVQALFQTLGYPPGVAAVLAGLCTANTPRSALDAALPAARSVEEQRQRWQLAQRHRAPHLPQGAPTSPALANLIAFRLDLRLAAILFRYIAIAVPADVARVVWCRGVGRGSCSSCA